MTAYSSGAVPYSESNNNLADMLVLPDDADGNRTGTPGRLFIAPQDPIETPESERRTEKGVLTPAETVVLPTRERESPPPPPPPPPSAPDAEEGEDEGGEGGGGGGEAEAPGEGAGGAGGAGGAEAPAPGGAGEWEVAAVDAAFAPSDAPAPGPEEGGERR